jgi:hypothetical protein
MNSALVCINVNFLASWGKLRNKMWFSISWRIYLAMAVITFGSPPHLVVMRLERSSSSEVMFMSLKKYPSLPHQVYNQEISYFPSKKLNSEICTKIILKTIPT